MTHIIYRVLGLRNQGIILDDVVHQVSPFFKFDRMTLFLVTVLIINLREIR